MSTHTAVSKTRAQTGLAQYDPDKGAKSIKLLKTAAKHWEHVRDFEKAAAAIREKCERQAEFVLWWDTQAEKDPGNKNVGEFGGRKKPTAKDPAFDRLEDYGLDKFLIHQWRKKYGRDPEAFEQNVAAEIERVRMRVECVRAPSRSSLKAEKDFHWIEAVRLLRGVIRKQIAAWPTDALALVPNALRDMADILEVELNARGGPGSGASVSDHDTPDENGSAALVAVGE